MVLYPSMRALIIETSTSPSLVCIADKKKDVDVRIFEHSINLSKELMPSIKELFSKNNLSLQDLNYIAIGIGPGSYTGTRVGAIIGKSLAFSLKLPLIGFESPLAFLPDLSGTFAYIADAKMNQYYLLKGVKSGEQVQLNTSPQILDKERLLKEIEGNDFIVGPAEFSAMAPLLNLPLITSICYEKFLKNSEQTLELLYYR